MVPLRCPERAKCQWSELEGFRLVLLIGDPVGLQCLDDVFEKKVVLSRLGKPAGRQSAVVGHGENRADIQIEHFGNLGRVEDRRVRLADTVPAIAQFILNADHVLQG